MNKIRYCSGCGVRMQDENILNVGFTTNLDNELCMRCFRLKNYGEYESVSSNVIDYEKIMNGINKKKDLVLYVVDILNIPKNLEDIKKVIKNDCLLILNKRDLLPLSVKDEKIIEYIKNQNLGFIDIVIVSSEKNNGMDNLLSKIKKYQKSSDVYVVGYTNAGKSSLISKFIHDYGNNDNNLTISPLPSTTLNQIEIPINDKLTLIDTPGIVDNSNMINFVDKKMYKKLNSKREIKPKTFQIRKNEALLVGDLLRINYLEGDTNSFTFYIPNEIKIRRLRFKSNYLKDLASKEVDIKFSEDLCIMGLGFIKVVAGCKIELFINKDTEIFTRKNLI